MSEIVKSIGLGVLTITIWLVASILLNDTRNTNETDNSKKEQITFVETLTIDYEGDTTKI